MNYTEFNKRVRHNTTVLREAISTKTPLTNILSNLATYTNLPGELHSSVLMRNAHDILPAAYLGLLANVDSNGMDAFEVQKDNSVIPFELKTSEINSKHIWRGVNGGLYIGKSYTHRDKCAVTSRLTATYNLRTDDNTLSKKLHTILMVADINGPDGYFAAYEMDPETILHEYLLRPRRNASHNVTVKLGSFMKNGYLADTVVPLMGFAAWREKVARNAPRLQPGDRYEP